jgi:hypothetical protein
MGCWTGYLLRDVDGSYRSAVSKYGRWLITDADDRAEIVAWIRRDGLTRGTARVLEGWHCHGVALDLPGRRYRFYRCAPTIRRNESADRLVRAAPAWAGWDAGLARGGREELGEVIPGMAAAIEPYALAERPLRDLPLGARDRWFVDWDAERFEIAVRDDPASADWAEQGCGLVTVVTSDLRLLDYRIATRYSDADDLLPWLTYGPALVDALLARAPFPVPWEQHLDAGVLIDVDRGAVRYWADRHVPARLLAAVNAAWPGWRVARLPYGHAEHLALTGRLDPEALDDGSNDGVHDDSHRDALAGWITERSALPADQRPLRAPHIRVDGQF